MASSANLRPLTLRGRLFGRLADYARRYLTASVEHRLTHVLTVQGALQDRLEAMSAQNERLEFMVHRLTSLAEATQGALGNALVSVDASVASVSREVSNLPGLMGPRFDELDIKVRPLIAFDETSYAVRLRDGYAMIPRQEPIFAVMVANASSGGLEPGTRRVLNALIQPGMGVADVGANVGLLTLSCAVATGPSGKVFAFEPEAGPRAQLEKTLKLNGLRWVEVFDQAAGALTEERMFHISPVIGHSSLYALPQEDGDGRDVTVQVSRLDDIIGPDQRLDVVKIDVEGAELDVLSGMDRLLSENPDLAIVAEYGPSHLARIGLTPKSWFDAFKKAGFQAYAIEEPTGVCRRVSPADLVDVVSINLAFVRPKGAAKTRLPL
ncbi:FkbM family methyltransferase [Tabrizicola sp.]|uniref:FkbM family methyltransferase n=1 Tax=Tabrizicola sp. TaxID=2005166 RepID=UPI002734838F|nr:FkbM family methyltransferase [Tabrizicola sp.]MDP3196647.1 FkbM family methyltransferase [Tabrizicola sp.]